MKLAAAVAASVVTLHAGAALTFSESVAGPGVYAAPVFTTATPALAYAASDSATDLRLAPLGSTGDFLVVSTGGSAVVDLGGVSSYSFLWGSPDLFNEISILTSSGLETFTGADFQSMFGLTASGDNTNTRLFTILAGIGQTLSSITFASGGVAFELAIAASPVPEPETYALLLAGLLFVIYVGARSNRRDRN